MTNVTRGPPPALSPHSLHHEAAASLSNPPESVPFGDGHSFTPRRLTRVHPEGCYGHEKRDGPPASSRNIKNKNTQASDCWWPLSPQTERNRQLGRGRASSKPWSRSCPSNASDALAPRANSRPSFWTPSESGECNEVPAALQYDLACGCRARAPPVFSDHAGLLILGFPALHANFRISLSMSIDTC